MRKKSLLMLMIFVSLSFAIAVKADEALKEPLCPIQFQYIKLDGFWKAQVKRLTEKWLPHCVKQLESGETGKEFGNFVIAAKVLAGEKPEEKRTGFWWSDAYVFNIVESICLALTVDPDGDEELAHAQQSLRNKIEEWIPVILAAQCRNGYIHTPHTIDHLEPYHHTDKHEFYTQGYFIEMGIAHYHATGEKDRRLLDAAIRCADHLNDTFGPEAKRSWVHGHAGMGYALCRLARLVNDINGNGAGDKYYKLAKHLLDHHHETDKPSSYNQTDRPLIEMNEAAGHSVRATYFYTAIADLAMLAEDKQYQAVADKLWASMVHRKLYITGGVGSSLSGDEGFDDDYVLPNRSYCEACAGCGLTFWASRMHWMHGDAHYVDVQERTLYNNILGSIDLSGGNFFYQNPLIANYPRYSWHPCPCCVGNIPRALLAIKDLIYSLNAKKDILYINHYVACTALIKKIGGNALTIQQQTDYPVDGKVKINLTPTRLSQFAVKLRIPNRAESKLYTAVPDLDGQYSLTVNGEPVSLPVSSGYVTIKRTWNRGDVLELELPMEMQRVYADQRVADDRGRVALQRGPLVYNIEQVDNNTPLQDMILKPDAQLHAVWKPEFLKGVCIIEGKGLIAIPNYARLNRGGASQVWVVENPDKLEFSEEEKTRNVLKASWKELDSLTVDSVAIGEPESEKEHNLNCPHKNSGTFYGLKWRDAPPESWLSYTLTVDPNANNQLLCTYWGDEVGNREFEILVEGKKIGEQKLLRNKPKEFFHVRYAIGPSLTHGKKKVTVTFQGKPGCMVGGLFDIRMMKVDKTFPEL